MVAGAVDLCLVRRGGTDQQCRRACVAAGGAVAQGELWLRQRSREPVRGAAADRDSVVPPARTVATGLPGIGGGRGVAGRPPAVSAPCTIGRLNGYVRVLVS